MSDSDLWTNTLNTGADDQCTNKFFVYRGIPYVAQCLHAVDEIRPHPAEFIYERVKERIEADRFVFTDMMRQTREFRHHAGLDTVPWGEENNIDPFWANPFFPQTDARVACGFMGRYNPRTLVEVGSGYSTRFLRKSIKIFGLRTKITCIDPVPRANIDEIADTVHRKSVLDVDLDLFANLEAGDILFWDGSHVSFCGSDVDRFFLEVAPLLKRGVIVHIHDVYLPFAGVKTPFGTHTHSEQAMLACFLLSNSRAKVLMPNFYLGAAGEIEPGGASFWFAID